MPITEPRKHRQVTRLPKNIVEQDHLRPAAAGTAGDGYADALVVKPHNLRWQLSASPVVAGSLTHQRLGAYGPCARFGRADTLTVNGPGSDTLEVNGSNAPENVS
jgi:hypothetical protein